MSDIQPVSLCGNLQAHLPCLASCFESWTRLVGVEPFGILDDGSLDQAAVARLKSFGHDVVDSNQTTHRLSAVLKRYPNVAKIRALCPLFRKIVDPVFMYPNAKRILFVDTDVYFASRLRIESDESEFVFGVDDVSGYASAWVMPLSYSVVLGLNSGFLLYAPKIVDLELLDHLSARYLLKAPVRTRWWTEQAAWAVLGARASGPRVLDGRDYCVIGGLKKRSIEEIRTGRVKWFARNTPATEEYVREATDNVAVVHFAGSGRDYIDTIVPSLTCSDEVRVLRTSQALLATPQQRMLLAARLGVRGVMKSQWSAHAVSAYTRLLGRSVAGQA